MTSVSFRVYGTPKPQGSKRHVGNGVMIESAGEALRTWREDVKQAALVERAQLGHELSGPISATMTFLIARPRSHYRTGRFAHMLRAAAPDFPHRKPDIDKLLRSTFDAITSAALWHDDACVVSLRSRKLYATHVHDDAPGAVIYLESLTGDDA